MRKTLKSIKIDGATHELVDRIAKKEERTRTAVMARAVRLYDGIGERRYELLEGNWDEPGTSVL